MKDAVVAMNRRQFATTFTALVSAALMPWKPVTEYFVPYAGHTVGLFDGHGWQQVNCEVAGFSADSPYLFSFSQETIDRAAQELADHIDAEGLRLYCGG